MWITRVSIGNPVFATMMMVALLVLGLFSYQRLGVDQFPDVSFPIVVVSTLYPGASPETVETEVSRPIEEAVNSVSGIKTVSSRSYEDRSVVIVEFNLATDPAVAAQDVRDKVAQIKVSFRDEVDEPTVSRFNPDDQPIISIAVSSATRGLRDLTTLTDQVISKQLETVRGVGRVTVVGGVKRQIRIDLKPAEMKAFGLSVNRVVDAINEENQDLPAGSITTDRSETLVKISGRIVDPKQFAGLIVARRGGTPVRLGQVANIEDSQEEESSSALVDGKHALSADIVKIQGANTIAVAEGVRETVAELGRSLPADVELSVVRDTSIGIRNSVADTRTTLIEGAALTIAIVFLFLMSWRSTLITGLTLPIALIGTFLAIYAFGYTINVMTMMALSLSVGILIDDAIVVRENIVRHVAMGKDHHAAALEGTQEIGLAVMATTFTIVAVFLPVAFMGGIIGQFFFQFGITVSAAVLISLFVSFTLDPMLSSIWPDPSLNQRPKKGPAAWLIAVHDAIGASVSGVYRGMLAWSLGHRKSVLALALLIFIGSFMLVPMIGTEFVPEADLGEAQITLEAPVGSSLDYTRAKVRQVDAALHEFPEVDYTYATINTGASVGKNTVALYVRLTDRKSRARSQKQLQQVFRQRLSEIAGLKVAIGTPSGMSGGKPIQVSVQGQDIAELEKLANAVMEAMRKIPGMVDIDSSLEAAKPTLSVELNRDLASDLGIGIDDVGQALRPLIAGKVTGSWKAPDGESYDVSVQLPKSERTRASDLDQVYLASNQTNADGTPRMVPLRQVTQLVPALGATQINRKDLKREVLVGANASGRPAGDLGKELGVALAKLDVPPGYRLVMGGSTKDLQETAGYAAAALSLAIIFIYLILASQFGSFLQPVAIMASLPLSLIGVFLALLITGSTLNIFSIIGFIMLMGLVTKNAILLVDFANQAVKQGKSRFDAIVEAGSVRLRPIMMTTAAMIFGMIPLALGLGEGGEQRSAMAHAVIGGLITSTLLTLLVVPVIYSYLEEFSSWVKRKLRHTPVIDAGLSQVTGTSSPQR